MPKVPFTVNDIEVDGTTLTVDEANNRVGIGTANPGVTLDVVGVLKASDGVVTLTSAGTPSATIADGALAVDTTNDKLFIRSGSAWVEVSGGAGGGSVDVLDTPPTSPSAADLWYESDTGNFYIYYDSQWVEVGVGGGNSLGTDINTTVTTTTDTLAVGDRWKLTQYSNASLVTVTVPTGTFSTGDWFMLQSTGAGGLTLSTTGLTVNGANTTIAESEGMMVVFTASNTISVFGGTS